MLPTSLGAFPGLLLHPSPHPPGSPRAWTPGSPVWSRLPGWRPASGRGPAHAAWVATPAPPHAALGRRTGGRLRTRSHSPGQAGPLTCAGGAGPRAGGGAGRTCAAPTRGRRGLAPAAADAEPVAAPGPRAPPPRRGHFRDRSRPRGGPASRWPAAPGPVSCGPRLGEGRTRVWRVSPVGAVALGCPQSAARLWGKLGGAGVGRSAEEETEARRGGRPRAAGWRPVPAALALGVAQARGRWGLWGLQERGLPELRSPAPRTGPGSC